MIRAMFDRARDSAGSLTRGIGGVLRIVALVVGVLVVAVFGLGNRGTAGPSTPPTAVVVPAAGAAQSDPTPSPASPMPPATPIDPPTSAPTAVPTPAPAVDPAPDPTPKPTPKPTTRTAAKATPKPTHDPTPEGTPRITTDSGSFGSTLTVRGITVRVAKTAPQDGALNCVTDDPDRQGWTELVSYELTMTWPDAGDAEEPWVAVGSKPWNVLNFDGPSPFKSGADYVVSTCHRPSDSDKVKVEISPPGSPLIYYRWFFD